ncbi:hypothetical protein ACFJGW_00510 [Burkholderiaceae bacterium UC74_6]
MDELSTKIREAMALASDEPHTKEALQNALTFHEAALERAAASNQTQEG